MRKVPTTYAKMIDPRLTECVFHRFWGEIVDISFSEDEALVHIKEGDFEITGSSKNPALIEGLKAIDALRQTRSAPMRAKLGGYLDKSAQLFVPTSISELVKCAATDARGATEGLRADHQMNRQLAAA